MVYRLIIFIIFLWGSSLYAKDDIENPIQNKAVNIVPKKNTENHQEEKPKKNQKRKFTKTFIIPYPLVFNNEVIGELNVEMTIDNQYFIIPSELAGLLKDNVEDDILNKLSSDKPIKVEKIKLEGLKTYIEPTTQEFIVEVELDDQKEKNISISDNSFIDNTAYTPLAAVSSYVNLYPTMYFKHSFADNVKNGYDRTDLYMEGATRLFGEDGFTLEGSGQYLDNNNYYEFTRNDLRLVYDRPDYISRITLGDLNSNVTSFQEWQKIGGLSFSSEFGLQPNKLFRPTGQRSLDIQNDAEVDVYVNGAKYKTIQLQSGRYNLTDFPFLVGNNNVELRVKDRNTGKVEQFSFTNYQDFSQLGAGHHEFSYNTGVTTKIQQGDYIYEDTPVYSAYHRYGLTDFFTIGLNSQGTEIQQSHGLSIIFGTPLGSLGSEISYSHSDKYDEGYAYNLRHRYQNSDKDSVFGLVDGFSAENSFTFYNHNYTALLDTPSELKWSYYNNLNLQVLDNISLFTSYQFDTYYQSSNTDYRQGLTVGTSFYITTDLNAVGQVRYYDQQGTIQTGQDEISAFFTLSWRPLDNHYASASYETATKTSRLDYDITDYNEFGDTSANLGISNSYESKQASFDGSVHHKANRFTLDANTNHSIENFKGNTFGGETSLKLGTSLAFADGALAFGQPIFDSYAIVKPHESLDETTVKVVRGSEKIANQSDGLGNIMIADLYPYNSNNVKLEFDNLPMGYDVGQGDYTLNPYYKSGSVIEVGSDYAVTVIGEVEEDLIDSLIGIVAKVKDKNDKKFKPVVTFINEGGRFALSGLKSNTEYTIQFASRPSYKGSFFVTKTKNNLVKLGKIKLESQ